MDHYGDIPLDKYRTMLIDCLRYLIPEEGGTPELPETAGTEPDTAEFGEFEEVEEGIDTPPEPPAAEIAEKEDSDEELSSDEEKLLKVIAASDPKAAGIDWDVLEKAAKKAGLKKEAFDAAAEGLLDKGMIYEPMMGKIRKI